MNSLSSADEEGGTPRALIQMLVKRKGGEGSRVHT